MSSLSMEGIVRPFVKIESRPLPIFTPAPVTDLEDLPPAFIRWGSPSNFITPSSQLSGPYVVNITNDFSGENIDLTSIEQQLQNFQNTVNRIQQERSIFDWDREIEIPEESRQVTVVRIYNPDELDLPEEERTSFLDVERIDRITFRMPEGQRWTYVLNNEDN